MNTRSDTPMRAAIVFGRGITRNIVDRYLPANYRVVDADVTGADGDSVIIEGMDVAGWTLDGYVLPRLASGCWFGQEIETADDNTGLTTWTDEDDFRESQASDHR